MSTWVLGFLLESLVLWFPELEECVCCNPEGTTDSKYLSPMQCFAPFDVRKSVRMEAHRIPALFAAYHGGYLEEVYHRYIFGYATGSLLNSGASFPPLNLWVNFGHSVPFLTLLCSQPGLTRPTGP